MTNQRRGSESHEWQAKEGDEHMNAGGRESLRESRIAMPQIDACAACAACTACLDARSCPSGSLASQRVPSFSSSRLTMSCMQTSNLSPKEHKAHLRLWIRLKMFF